MDNEWIPPRFQESTPDQVYGLSPDGEDVDQPETLYPAYPDLPYPEPGNRWEYNNDPLIHDEEAASRQVAWNPEDPLSLWVEPHIPRNCC